MLFSNCYYCYFNSIDLFVNKSLVFQHFIVSPFLQSRFIKRNNDDDFFHVYYVRKTFFGKTVSAGFGLLLQFLFILILNNNYNIIIIIVVIINSLSFIYPSVSSTKAFTPTIVVVKKDKPDQSTGRQELLLSKRNSQRVAEVLALYTPFLNFFFNLYLPLPLRHFDVARC